MLSDNAWQWISHNATFDAMGFEIQNLITWHEIIYWLNIKKNMQQYCNWWDEAAYIECGTVIITQGAKQEKLYQKTILTRYHS